MGGAVSAGKSNDELIDNLIEAGYIEREQIERVFKRVDRGFYLTPREQREAYKDLAWRSGNLHLSAPCIYAKVLEALELQAGSSFLNIGSGTGYLSTMAGLLIGSRGINHGVEVHEKVVEYAQRKFIEFVERSDAVHEYEICAPQFVVGNALLIEPGRLYSRVYCGAAVTNEHEPFLKNMLAIGGVLVMPLRDQLVRVTRDSETEWSSKTVLPVSFASLVRPSSEESGNLVKLPDTHFPTLCELCRVCVRSAIREHVRHGVPKWSSYVATQRERKANETASASASASGSASLSASTSPKGEQRHTGTGGEENSEENGADGEDDDDDSDGPRRARKRGCFGMLPGFRSRHSRSSKQASPSTSASASASASAETRPNDAPARSASASASASAPSHSESWLTPRVSDVQLTVNGTPRRFIRITMPGSSYFFEQPSTRANGDTNAPGPRQREEAPADDTTSASSHEGEGALEQVINELFVVRENVRNRSQARSAATPEARNEESEQHAPDATRDDSDSSSRQVHGANELEQQSEGEQEPEIFPRLVWRVGRPPQRVNQATDPEADADADADGEGRTQEGEIVLPDYFGERSDSPKFKTLMRAAVDRLSLPVSLKCYLMFERRITQQLSGTASVPTSNATASKVQTDAHAEPSADGDNCLV